MDMLACNKCGKSVKDFKFFKCNLCLTKVNLKRNFLNYFDSQCIKFLNKTWHCYICSNDLFSLTTINNFSFYPLLSDRIYCNSDSIEPCLTLNNLSNLFNELTYFFSEIINTTENVIN